MSLNDHRRRAEGQRVRMPRMPKEAKLGTRIHEDDCAESVPDVDRCPLCNKFVELEELTELEVCYSCYKKQEQEGGLNE